MINRPDERRGIVVNPAPGIQSTPREMNYWEQANQAPANQAAQQLGTVLRGGGGFAQNPPMLYAGGSPTFDEGAGGQFIPQQPTNLRMTPVVNPNLGERMAYAGGSQGFYDGRPTASISMGGGGQQLYSGGGQSPMNYAGGTQGFYNGRPTASVQSGMGGKFTPGTPPQQGGGSKKAGIGGGSSPLMGLLSGLTGKQNYGSQQGSKFAGIGGGQPNNYMGGSNTYDEGAGGMHIPFNRQMY